MTETVVPSVCGELPVTCAHGGTESQVVIRQSDHCSFAFRAIPFVKMRGGGGGVHRLSSFEDGRLSLTNLGQVLLVVY